LEHRANQRKVPAIWSPAVSAARVLVLSGRGCPAYLHGGRPLLPNGVSPAAEAPRHDPGLLPGADASSQGSGGDEGGACFLVASQGEDHASGAEGCGQSDRGPGEGVLCARVLCAGLVRRVRLGRRRSVRLRVIRVVVCGGHGKPSFLVCAAARGELVKGPWTGGELAAQVRWSCPVAPPDTEETAPRGEPIRVLANLSAAAVVPPQHVLLAVPIHGL
jgi:hypothetical protein